MGAGRVDRPGDLRGPAARRRPVGAAHGTAACSTTSRCCQRAAVAGLRRGRRADRVAAARATGSGWLYLGVGDRDGADRSSSTSTPGTAWSPRPASLPARWPRAGCRRGCGRSGSRPLFTFGLLLYPDARLPVAALAVGGGRRRRSPSACLRRHRRSARARWSTTRSPTTRSGSPAPARCCEPIGTRGVPAGARRPRRRGRRALIVRWRRAPAGGIERRQISLLAPGRRCCAWSSSPCPGGDDQPPWLAVAASSSPSRAGAGRDRGGDPAPPPLRHRRRPQPVAGLRRADRARHRALRRAGVGARAAAGPSDAGPASSRPAIIGGRSCCRCAPAAAAGRPGDVRRPRRPVRRAVPADRPAAGRRRPRAALPAVAEAIAASLRLPYVRSRPPPARPRRTASRAAGPLHEIPLDHQGEHVGRLLARGRDRRPLPPATCSCSPTWPGRPAPRSHAAGLADALRASRSGWSRPARRSAAGCAGTCTTGSGPTLAGVGLGLDVAAGLVDDDPAAARRAARPSSRARRPAPSTTSAGWSTTCARPPSTSWAWSARCGSRPSGWRCAAPASTSASTPPSALPRLGAATEVAAYRIALEAVTNSRPARRAPALLGPARRRRRCCGSRSSTTARASPSGTPAGVGLAAMRERAAEIGGECTVDPAEPAGTRVLALLPLDPP